MALRELHDDRVLISFISTALCLILLNFVGRVQNVTASEDLTEGSLSHALANLEAVVEDEAAQLEDNWDTHA